MLYWVARAGGLVTVAFRRFLVRVAPDEQVGLPQGDPGDGLGVDRVGSAPLAGGAPGAAHKPGSRSPATASASAWRIQPRRASGCMPDSGAGRLIRGSGSMVRYARGVTPPATRAID
ncbi:hypothetical protein GCM10010207_18630 [Streptomyces atratus]|nr:hypothetical protein GCM10010207_18630 [Streptomyces atratus]